jgi:phosphoglycolate phosphatase
MQINQCGCTDRSRFPVPLGKRKFPDMRAQIHIPLSVKLVLFDLDGTLVDTAPDLASAANYMLRDLGRTPWTLQHYRAWIGNGMARFVKRALTGEMHVEPDATLFERGFASFNHHYSQNVSGASEVFAGAIAALDALKVRGFTLGCVTNKAGAFTRPLLKDLELDGYFALVVAGDTVARLKPDPMPLHYACEQMGVAPEYAVFVGDSENDVTAARAAAMPVICVSYGYNHGRDIRELAPDIVIDSLTDVPQYLRLIS